MSKVILTDTGFWLGLLDAEDQYHEASMAIGDLIESYTIIFPWPCLYETIDTRLTRRTKQLILLEELISKPNIIFLDDTDYKSEALKQTFIANKFYGSTHSLTDSVIREMLKDINVKVNYLVTYNESDFKDICDQRLIQIISG